MAIAVQQIYPVAHLPFAQFIRICHIPPDFVVNRWGAGGASGSHHDFRF
jgi:hypothetical protein